MDSSIIKDFVKLASRQELIEMEKACHGKQREIALAQKNQLEKELNDLLDKIKELGFDLELVDKRRDARLAYLQTDGVEFYLKERA